jgi:hypothetical protein
MVGRGHAHSSPGRASLCNGDDSVLQLLASHLRYRGVGARNVRQIRAQARCRNPWSRVTRRSLRTPRRRKPSSEASVPSTTQRYRPSQSEESMLRRAMRGAIREIAEPGAASRSRRPYHHGVCRGASGAGSRSWANDRRNRVDERDASGRVVDVGRREADG